MNAEHEDRADELKAPWLGWAWILPQLILLGLNWHAWVLVRGDMTPFQLSRGITIGLFELGLLGAGGIALVIQNAMKRPIGLGLALAAIAAHTGYLWLFLQSIDRLLPPTVSLWMLPQTELIFYQFSLMMPVIFLMLVRLARTRLGLSAGVDVGVSCATIVIIPAGAFIFGSMLARFARNYTWHDNFEYLLIAAMVAGTACILVAFLRLMRRLHDLIQRRSWSQWALPLAAGLVAPLSGLALNATIPFPYDFQDMSVYLMTVLNAVALLIPFQTGTRWALPGWLARAVFYPFTVYFFLVFLPFLPLSLLAMIAAGAGFLILAPLFLFTIHTRRLWDQGRLLATQYGSLRIVAALIACILVLPAALMLRNESDRRTLTQAVDAVFSPDYTSTRVAIRAAPLLRALDRMDDMKHGIYLPYVSDIYDTMVFHGMVLPDEKADLIRKSLLGKAKDSSLRSSLWGNGFLGGRNRNQRQSRGSGVTRSVAVASHESQCQTTNGMSEAEVRFVLENRGGANGEFSERIAVPEGVLVTGFWLDVNGTNKLAQLRERKAATWVYEMIRDMTRRDPGLLVYEDDRHLRLRVYPFAAGEKRKCGLRFRFPAALQPSIRFNGTTISLADTKGIIPPSPHAAVGTEPDPPNTMETNVYSDGGTTSVSSVVHGTMAVSIPLENGATALVIPASVASNLPSFHREVVAHLVLDHSACAGTNRAAIVEKASSALKALPPSINRVRITWANYEQEDVPGEPLSREAALAALNHGPGLPAQGGFCAERVIARVLLSQNSAPHASEPAGYASLFIVIPAPGSIPIRSDSLSAFTRLAPDLPAYALFDDRGVTRIPFQGTATTPAKLGDFVPSAIVALRDGNMTACVAQDKDALLFAPERRPARPLALQNTVKTLVLGTGGPPACPEQGRRASAATGWQVWNPSSGQFEKLEPPTVCNDSAYQAGLALWSRHRDLTWDPSAVDAALPDLIRDTRTIGLLIPEAAFIVLETTSQEVMLGRKEKQSLNANHALEFDNAKTEKAPAPLAAWLIIPAFWLLWRFRGRICISS